ncbi:hypothetical protein ACFOZY_13305 [Chungangia koreensis]|uniref:Ferritin-like domain-containing protein n=1 Tax=Chungangia koreensis TaxID=752657 RepID=A0ABV8X8U0_9LACT
MGLFSQDYTSNTREPILFPEPPKALSTKDLSFLTDMLDWNLLAAKKMRAMSKQCKMPDLKKEFEAAEQMHAKHYDKLLQFMKDNAGGAQS